jgi:hypothetical protein
MTHVLIPCCQSAHDQNVLARRPQWGQHGCPSEGKKPNEPAWNIKYTERATDRTTFLVWTLVRIVLPKNVLETSSQPQNGSRRRVAQLERWNRGGYHNNKIEQSV